MTVARPPSVVVASPETGGFAADWAAGSPRALAFLARHPTRASAWAERAAETSSRPPSHDVLERARADAARLGADAQALAAADELLGGDACCVATGQQPGLFLGPLFTMYKAWTAVALAVDVERRTGRRTVPLFWNGADDSDFAEIATAVLPERDLRLVRVGLEGGELPAGGMVGDLSTAGTSRALAAAEPALGAWPRWPALVARLREALGRARDHGELAAAVLYGVSAGTGLLVVDGRWAEMRRAAAPLFRRYAERRERVGALVREAGRRLEADGYRARLMDAATEQALFDASDGRRRAFSGSDRDLLARVDASPETLSPSVLLRPLVQDSVFPNVATVCGPGEVAYHAQLAPVYAELGVGAPVLFPRFEATLVPDGVFGLAQRRGVAPIDLVRDFDAAMKSTASAALPAELRASIDGLEESVSAAADGARRSAEAFDASLAASADEALRRCREAIERFREKAAQAARSAEAKRDPSLRHYREFLRPRGLPQERVLGALTLALTGVPEGAREAVHDHVGSIAAGRPAHWLLRFEPAEEHP